MPHYTQGRTSQKRLGPRPDAAAPASPPPPYPLSVGALGEGVPQCQGWAGATETAPVPLLSVHVTPFSPFPVRDIRAFLLRFKAVHDLLFDNRVNGNGSQVVRAPEADAVPVRHVLQPPAVQYPRALHQRDGRKLPGRRPGRAHAGQQCWAGAAPDTHLRVPRPHPALSRGGGGRTIKRVFRD